MKSVSIYKMATLIGLALVSFACNEKSYQSGSITIKADKSSVPMGRSIKLSAHIRVKSGEAVDYLLLPYVNQRRWGSHERPDQEGNATFLLPLPNPGKVEIQVVAVKAEPTNWMGTSDRQLLMVGNLFPDSGVFSNPVTVVVNKRTMPLI